MRASQPVGDDDHLAGPGGGARQRRRAGGEFAERGDGDDDGACGRARQVAAEGSATRATQFVSHAVGELDEPVDTRALLRRERHDDAGGPRAHRDDVGEVLGDHLDPDVVGARPVVAPVEIEHHRVGRDDGTARREGQDGRVVTGPDLGVGRREVGGDRREHAGLPDVGDGRRVAADPRCPGLSEPRGGREVGHHAIQSAAAS